MKRSIAVSITLVVGTILFALAPGCGGEEDPRRVDTGAEPAAESAPGGEAVTKPADPEFEQRLAAVERLLDWPESAGERRDARTDYRACEEGLAARSDMQAAHPLARFAWLRDCMEEKGWIVERDPDVPQG
jgi:hypothetical protein